MKNAPMQWIEQAEARQVLAAALFERAPLPSWYSTVCAAASKRLLGTMAMIAPRGSTGWLLLQAQPALIRPAAGHRARIGGDDRDYRGSW